MADTLPPKFGRRGFPFFAQLFGEQKEQGNPALPPLSAGQNVARLLPLNGPAAAPAADSRSVVVALLWLAGFAAAELLLNRPGLMPTVPGTELRLISAPMALFAVALMLTPASEAPLYCLVYV